MANKCCGCISNAVLGICASIYLLLGTIIFAAGCATFVTPFGQIVPPLYAGCMIGGGVGIFIIACVGLCAACESQKKQNVCPLWIFTLLTFVMLVLASASTVIMFQYESVLSIASAAGGEETSDSVDGAVGDAKSLLAGVSTTVIETLATNTFDACGANVTMAGGAIGYVFTCNDDSFSFLEETITLGCLNPQSSINATNTSLYSTCYSSHDSDIHSFPDLEAPVFLSEDSIIATLNTPKGLYCACSSTLIDSYVMPYLAWAKYISLVIIVFFVLVLFACIHQICQRGCCGGKNKSGGDEQFNDIQMTYPAGGAGYTAGKKKSRLNDNGFIARP